jgi:hypothetical protein
MGNRQAPLWASLPIALLLAMPGRAVADNPTVGSSTPENASPEKATTAQAPPLEFQFDRSTVTRRALEDLAVAEGGTQLAEKLQFGAVRIAEADANSCNPAGRYVIVHFESGRYFQIYEESSPDVWGDSGGLTAASMTEAVRLFRRGMLCD